MTKPISENVRALILCIFAIELLPPGPGAHGFKDILEIPHTEDLTKWHSLTVFHLLEAITMALDVQVSYLKVC